MSHRRVVAAALAAALLALGAASGPAAPAGAATTAPLPTRLSHLAGSRQVVVVQSRWWDTTYASVTAWQQSGDGSWTRVLGPARARIGWNGYVLAGRRLQSTGTTPVGTFTLTQGFGSQAVAGTRIPYRVTDGTDWWTYDPRDPSTYNLFQPHRAGTAAWRTTWAEHLVDFAAQQYRYAVVVDFNRPGGVHWDGSQFVADRPADTRRGGGIFLHVRGPGATAGCVGVDPWVMQMVLRWLNPAQHPKIVIAPSGYLSRA